MAQIFLHFSDREMSSISMSNKEIFNLICSLLKIVHKHCQIHSPANQQQLLSILFAGLCLDFTLKPIFPLAMKFTFQTNILLGHDVHVTADFLLRRPTKTSLHFFSWNRRPWLHVTADLFGHKVHITADLLMTGISHTFWQKIRESK